MAKIAAPTHEARPLNPDQFSFRRHATSIRFRARLELVSIAQTLVSCRGIICCVDAKRIAKLTLAAPCPTCGAAPGQKCELNTGYPRTTPHRDRRLDAADKEKTKLYELLGANRE